MSDSTKMKRLYKSRTDRMIDGVCGGVAKYFNLDPTLVRIAWVLLTLLGGSGILLYIAAMIVVPKEPLNMMEFAQPKPSDRPTGESGNSPSSKKNSLFWGVLLMVIGIVVFLHNIGFSFWHNWWWFGPDLLVPVLLILAGVAFLWGGRNSLSSATAEADAEAGKVSMPSAEAAYETPRRLYRSFNDTKLFGVCGGLGEYFGIDSTIVRILFIVAAFASGGIVVLGYLLMAIILPKEIPSFKVS